MNVRVVIVDDHERFRQQARELLQLDDFTVVGESGTGRDGVELTEQLSPDLVLLDVGLPDIIGFDLVTAMHDSGARVVLTSSRSQQDYGTRVDDSGAEGFIGKDELTADAIRNLLG
jgi:DNA-binding NarL/FixJ family response regulator